MLPVFAPVPCKRFCWQPYGGAPVTISVLDGRRLLAAGLIALLVTLGLTSPAEAALGTPTGLTPSGSTITGNPVLQWNRVTGATSYRVDLSNQDDFLSGVVSYTTVNRRLVPPAHLKSTPSGEIFWRVRAINSSGSGLPLSASFFRNALAGPTLVSPTDGQPLQQPGNPPVLSWKTIPGATSYTIQVDTDDSFVAPFTIDNKTTSTTSYLIPTPLIAQAYHWRVKATLSTGVETTWSEVRVFEPSGLTPPVLAGPTDNADTQVVDVVLDWNPVPGATKYALQISTDENFLSGVTTVSDIVGTRYSPATTLGNDQYWWRVRPYDAGGNFLDWSAVSIWTFQRHWPDQPVLTYPVNEEVVQDPVFFQWQAVPHASSYTIEMHTASDFEPATSIIRCTTVHTTFVPTIGSTCWPGAAKSYYWRVVASDSPRNPAVVTDRIVSQVEHFHYLPQMVDLATATPANGATVSLPTLRWNPVPDAAKYRVYLTAIDGGSGAFSSDGVETSSTSFTPRTRLSVGKSYRWWVRTVSGSGRLGSGLVPEAQSVFTVEAQLSPTATTPEPTVPGAGAAFLRFPTLEWTPVVDASYYKLSLRPANGVAAFTTLTSKFGYPAGEDLSSTFLTIGLYEWRVQAYTAADAAIGTPGPISTFEMRNLPAADGHRAGLSGIASLDPATTCQDVLPERCGDLRTTPVLRWNHTPNAGFYKVTLSRDKEMTSILSTTTVDQNIFLPTTALPDSQAGSAYHWFVQACTTKCAPLGHALHAFNKKSNGVELISPLYAVGQPTPKVKDTITFTWRDWLATNRSGAGVDPETGVQTELEARQYRIEVATDEGFQTKIDTATVDQTTYTAHAKLYPEGPLYWRVMALDGNENLLTSSAIWRLDKESPVPALVSPVGGGTIQATEPFRWQPLNYSGSYNLEIYKDDTIALANRVLTANSKLVAYTASSPLPASVKAYQWRVQPVNASGHKGDWSAPGRFFVKVQAPVLISPTLGARVRVNDGLFSWGTVPGAASYKFERRPVGSTTATETVKTVALAYAPINAIVDGGHQWRVSAIDAKSQIIGASEWRSFLVDESRPIVTYKTPRTYAAVTANFTAKFSERVKGVSATSVRLYVAGRTSPLSARVTLSANRRWVTLNPTNNLVRGRYYTVRLSGAITDMNGNRLVATSWRVRAR